MLDDPRITAGFNNSTARQEFKDRWEFELDRFEGLNALADIDGIFTRADAFKREYIKEEERQGLFVFCSSEKLSRDVIQHLERLVDGRLLTYFWFNVMNGREQEILRERRIIILQLRQALHYNRLFTDIQRRANATNNIGQLRLSIGAGAPWITTVVTDPAVLDEDCGICRSDPFSNRTTVKLPCNHMFHEDCLKLCTEIPSCPYCRSKEARGAEPKLSAPTAGPMPQWLFTIDPFHRHEILRHPSLQPRLTYDEIDALAGIFNDARDRALKLFEALEPHHRKLSDIRQRIDILERKIEGSVFDIDQNKFDKLADAQLEMIRQAQRLNEEMGTDVNYFAREHFGAVGGTDRFREASGKAFDEVYATLKFLSSDDLLELSSLRLDEEDAAKKFYEAVDQWRVGVYARHAAEENWNLYSEDDALGMA
ncbi:hypothetical protein EAF04_001136 [Stromatinia cepivora]|nr:hypothetical protein EAF04_001136 [Stromatinia cepivora]